MSIPKNKKYFFYYLKENILIFNVSCYIDELAVHVADFIYDWNLLKDGKVSCMDKLIKELITKKIEQEIKDFKKVVNDNNCKMLSYFSLNSEPKEWKEFFTDPLKFIKISKRICKKNLPNFIEEKVNQNLFKTRKGKFLEFSCIIPSGEDEEFIVKALDKLKK
jgi:hypothetical protein